MIKKITTESHVKALAKEWYEQRNGYSYAAIQNGLGVHGVPDRVGLVPIVITPDMVGKRFGLFVGLECKRPGRRGEKGRGMSMHQAMFLAAVNAAGGKGVVVDGFEDLVKLDNDIFQQEVQLG